MTHYAVSQIVQLIQDNLHDDRYYDVNRFPIETRLRALIKELKPDRYPPVDNKTKFSLDEDFKDIAVAVLTNFRRVKKPTADELKQEAYERFMRSLAPVIIEDPQREGLWFKLSKLHTALEDRKILTERIASQGFWNRVNPKIKDLDHVYIITNYSYSKYPNLAVKHYKIKDLPTILKRLIQEGILNETYVPDYLLNPPQENNEGDN